MKFLEVEEVSNAVLDIFLERPLYVFLFLAIIWAPITEELTFRLGLLYSPFRLSFSISFLVMVFASMVLEFVDIHFLSLFPEWLLSFARNHGIYLYILTIVLLGSILGVVFKRKIDPHGAQKFYTANFAKIFYSFAILFAVLHLLNFYEAGKVWFLLPLLIFPQFLIGLVLAYIRMQYGVIWAIFGHFLHNGVIALPLVYLSLLPISFSEISSGKALDMDEIPAEIGWQASIPLLLSLIIAILVLISFVSSLMEYRQGRRNAS
jgi:hypothetical protein